MQELPIILAGPIVRRLTVREGVFWLATSQPITWRLSLDYHQEGIKRSCYLDQTESCYGLAAAEHLYIYLIQLAWPEPLPSDQWIGYDIQYRVGSQEAWESVARQHPELCYANKSRLGFVIRSQVRHILHGSCRKPHHPSHDGLRVADDYLARRLEQPLEWPALLMMSGDQVYVDDVATPMLVAIHRLIERLRFPAESLQAAEVACSTELHTHAAYYGEREQVLPKQKDAQKIIDILFKGTQKPVFTSDHAHNHLISLAEVLCMYLLVWSPVVWRLTDMTRPEHLNESRRLAYQQDQITLDAFIEGLPAVRRLLAHLPTAMIFDDHDVTVDWNLTAAWEQTAYTHDFSRRIIGNALCGYLVCQGWGNAPEKIPSTLMAVLADTLRAPGTAVHGQCIDGLLDFDSWHYEWPTEPKLVVMDTRTQRWLSRKNPNRPSGLMDWEALMTLHHSLLGQTAVILVSPAPIFGVKLIEAIQRLFTWLGKPLLVDAENWMAHKGAAYTLMNLFKHPSTPQHFVILSGDVHYSFVYKVSVRGRKASPFIWQITSSGLKNEFPRRLLDSFDRLNRWLYAPWSPLNQLTKRRDMHIQSYKPMKASHGERLLNGAGIGLVELDEHGQPTSISQLQSQGESVLFQQESE